MRRLLQKELADYRYELWCDQDAICPLCDKSIEKADAVLDHCHTTGRVRRVLHRACNSSEGRVMKWAYSSKSSDPYVFLKNLIKYHQSNYEDMPFHSTYLTDNEKEIKRLKKHQKKLKTHKAKERYQVKIDALIEIERRKTLQGFE